MLNTIKEIAKNTSNTKKHEKHEKKHFKNINCDYLHLLSGQ